MDDDAPKPDDLGERLAHLTGIVETEDKSVERALENVKHTQALLIGLCAIMIGAAVAFFVYILNRLDTLSLMMPHH